MTVDEAKFCRCCEKDRKREGKEPRVRLPIFYADKAEPAFICEYCDGDALRIAQSTEEPPPSGD